MNDNQITLAANRKSINLLEFESAKSFLLQPGVTTATFFQIDEIEQARASLKQRFFEILKLNPWLAGRLCSQKDNPRVQLVYPEEVTEAHLAELFHENEEIDINSKTEYQELYRKIVSNKRAYIDTGLKLKNKDKPLVSATLSATGNKGLVLIFSVSHIIGDGATYYALLNMLCSNDAVAALNPQRIESYSTAEAVGKADEEFLYKKARVFKTLLSWILGSNAKLIAYTINEAEIQKTKAESKLKNITPFISTNDIIVSGFMRAIRNKFCMMAVNFRGRFSGVTDKDAGNYEGVLFYDEEVYKTPEGIRQSLQSNLPFKTHKKPLPNSWECLRMHTGITTNWASFAGNFMINGHEHQLHLPIMPIKLPSDTMIVFRCRPNTTAVLILAEHSSRDSFVKDKQNPLNKYLGEPVSEDIFPVS